MCDTWVALRDSTRDGNVIFAKNSDRPSFDCQPLVFCSRAEWPEGSAIRLEYVEIPQVAHTYAHLGSSPYWCWGYEEGINEWGLVIGNEAIFTRTFREAAEAYRADKAPSFGLLGMDLIRLALERCRSARQAVELMGSLIEQYGQFGSAVPTKGHAQGGYDNSFIVADPTEAWIVEAVGVRWAARRVAQGCDSVSNEPGIRQRWDLGSPDLEAYAVERGWWPADSSAPFDFARAYVNELVPRQISHIRSMRSKQLLAEQNGRITPRWMQRIARDHYEDTFLQGPYFDAADPDFLSLCMHVSPADFTWGNTASSCIAVLPRSPGELPVFWWTPGPPCNGCYVPFFPHGSHLPAIVSRAGTFGKQVVAPDAAAADTFAPDSYWWLFRELMDRVKGDPLGSRPGYYPARNRVVRERFDALERAFESQIGEVLEQSAAARTGDPAAVRALDEFSARCVEQVLAALDELLESFGSRP